MVLKSSSTQVYQHPGTLAQHSVTYTYCDKGRAAGQHIVSHRRPAGEGEIPEVYRHTTMKDAAATLAMLALTLSRQGYLPR